MASKTRKTKRRQAQLFADLGHEIRLDALRILDERVASPNEIAKEIGASLNLVSHHVTVLKRSGTVELVKTVPRRGAVEHFYRARVPAMIDDAAWAKMPKKSRLVVYRTILQGMFAEAAAAEHEGSFDDDDAHLSWMTFEVDERGRAELTEAMADVLERVEQVKAACAERLAKSGETGEPMVTALMKFKRAARPGERRA
ncbi:MAG TPA: hypothetical protein VF085_08300 [Solirubrobacterales bacterium]